MELLSIQTLIGQKLARTPQEWGLSGKEERRSRADGKRGDRGQDAVDLSLQAPRPLPAPFFRDALAVADRLLTGSIDRSSEKRMREDRIFAAVTALAAIRRRSEMVSLYWPGGVPAPTKEELAAAYRRLRQRLSGIEIASDASQLLQSRQEMADVFAQADFSSLTAIFHPSPEHGDRS